MVTRRSFLTGGAAFVASAAAPALAAPDRVVTRRGIGLFLGGKPYRFAGANLWYGAWLGADTAWGNRDRLRRELDALAGMGVTNLRLAASAEDSQLRNSVKPASAPAAARGTRRCSTASPSASPRWADAA